MTKHVNFKLVLKPGFKPFGLLGLLGNGVTSVSLWHDKVGARARIQNSLFFSGVGRYPYNKLVILDLSPCQKVCILVNNKVSHQHIRNSPGTHFFWPAFAVPTQANPLGQCRTCSLAMPACLTGNEQYYLMFGCKTGQVKYSGSIWSDMMRMASRGLK